VAAGIWFLADIPIQRTWGRIAVGPYVAGAVVVTRLGVPGRSSIKVRAAIAALVFAAVALLPMGIEVAHRSRTDPGLHAQSEVIVTEEAARVLVDGRDPYAADYSSGPLHARPAGTRTHFPYLPGMLVFGLPRAADGSNGLTDARVWFTAITLVLAGLALWSAGAIESGRRLRTAQILLVLPTGALLMATSGDDLPVLALMLLAAVLAETGRPLGSGLALGLAVATKQTAWVVAPFLLLTMRDRTGRAWRRGTLAVGSVAAAFVLPFLLWDPGALVEDVVKFPLGLGRQGSPARTPTLGSWLVHAFPSARVELTLALVAAIGLTAVALLVKGGRRTPIEATRAAGILFVVALALAPAARIGYLVYPLNLLAWSWLLAPSSASPIEEVAPPVATGGGFAGSR
jgi:hypothetical protein